MPVTFKGFTPAKSKTPSDVLTEAEAASTLSITVSQLRRLSYARRGPKMVKVGSVRVVTRDALQDWLKSSAR